MKSVVVAAAAKVALWEVSGKDLRIEASSLMDE
jgi:hypothetical protein